MIRGWLRTQAFRSMCTRILLISILCFIVIMPSACRNRVPASLASNSSANSINRCVALRGNGTHVLAHVTSLARITSQWGVIDALAGGSSSTISTFLYESILNNQSVGQLTGKERAAAVSLLLKSVVGFAEETAAEPEWRSLFAIAEIVRRLNQSGVFNGADNDITRLASAISTVLASEDFRGLINPAIFEMLRPEGSTESRSYRTRVLEVRKAVTALSKFDAESPDVFFRAGIIHFPGFVSMIGRLGDFYAGRGLDFTGFLKECSPGTDQMLWHEISKKSTNSGTCGERFVSIVQQWKQLEQNRSRSRLLDRPGQNLKSIMITTIVNDPDSIKQIKEYDSLYQKGAPRQLRLDFSAVKFGYWTTDGMSESAITNWSQSSQDAKAKKAVWLGKANNWREILEKSPQEPSLGRYVQFAETEPARGSLSLGGWADLHPVQVLQSIGCKEVIYLTRRSAESSFVSKGPPFSGRPKSGLAELLGMTEADYNQLYSLNVPTSSFSMALHQADGVWCTDWNGFVASQQNELATDGWNAPLLTKNPALMGWSQASSSQRIEGCSSKF
jgi:hypothetical protein